MLDYARKQEPCVLPRYFRIESSKNEFSCRCEYIRIYHRLLSQHGYRFNTPFLSNFAKLETITDTERANELLQFFILKDLIMPYAKFQISRLVTC